jgi:DNA polymerase III subunit delta'
MSWKILGHEWAVDLLSRQIANNRLHHAYLITGPSGVGRRTLTVELAKAVNCPSPPAPGHSCGVCSTCTRIEKMQHPDLSVVQAEQEGATLKVEQVRSLQHGLSLSPYEARYKTALLLRFEEAHPSASNALLKTLEEPSPQVILILTANSAENLLPTIVSRCAQIRLKPVPAPVIQEGLVSRWSVPEEQAGILAHLCSGRPGYAVRLFQDPGMLDRRTGWLDDHAALLESSRSARFRFAEGLAKDKESARQALMVWLSYWRDVLLLSAGTSIPITNQDRCREIEELARTIDMGDAHRIVLDIENTLRLLDRNANARLALEVLWLNLPRAALHSRRT